MNKPAKNEYPAFYHAYVDRIEEVDINDALEKSLDSLQKFVMSIPEDKYEHSYGDNKWKLKEVFIHLADTERVMQYRALRFSRNDETPLQGFEEKDFINNSNSGNLSFQEVVNDLLNVRKSTISFFNTCSEEMLMRKGIANNGNVTVRALGFIIVGHQLHHMNIIKERYL